LPTRRRLSENAESSDIRGPAGYFKVCFRVTPTGLADGLGLGLSLGNLANTPRLLGSPVSRNCAGFGHQNLTRGVRGLSNRHLMDPEFDARRLCGRRFPFTIA
jgi:hypothetical protein